MAKDLSNQLWHGIPRKEIPWFPAINNDSCIGCELCYVSCGREVFDYDELNRKAVVERNFNCMVGCSTCSTVCPTEAITFPGRDLIWKFEREYKIFKEVRKEGKEKRSKKEEQEERNKVESELSKLTTRYKIQLAGQFGEKKFLVKLEELIIDKPIDIVNFKLEVPTLKGHIEKAPAVMTFEITSTEQEDIIKYIDQIRKLAAENELVVASENKL
jgi:NAD-dependent dihydropyrimidine dehydrogenase PreA subunit